MVYSHVLTIMRPAFHAESLDGIMDSFIGHLTRMQAGDEGDTAKSVDYKLDILSPNRAADLYFQDFTLQGGDQCVDILAGLASHAPRLDWFIQAPDQRRKAMLVADMDSTMITIECIDELADYAGIKPQVSAITERAMQGELDFKQALQERVGLLKGMKAAVLDQCYKERVKYTDGAYSAVQTMARNGAITALVSGGFTFFTQKVAAKLGFQSHRANELTIQNQLLTGTITPPLSDSSTKIDVLNQLAAKHDLTKADIMAIGDGANDIPMIEGAGVGVAYLAKEKARAAADFQINHTDLRSLLYIQGYKDAEIVDDETESPLLLS